jgi:hypothetical protein
MRQSAKRNVCLCSHRIRIERLHRTFEDPTQARQDVGHILAGRGVPDDRNELDRWMAEDQSHQLRSRVSGASDDDRAYGLRGHLFISILILTRALSTA